MALKVLQKFPPRLLLKITLTTPTPHISKKYALKICPKTRGRMAYWGGGSALEIKGTFTENVLHEPTFTAYELRLLRHMPPLLCHMNRFCWGWRWSLIC